MLELMEAQQPLLQAQQATLSQLQVRLLHCHSVLVCSNILVDCGLSPR